MEMTAKAQRLRQPGSSRLALRSPPDRPYATRRIHLSNVRRAFRGPRDGQPPARLSIVSVHDAREALIVLRRAHVGERQPDAGALAVHLSAPWQAGSLLNWEMEVMVMRTWKLFSIGIAIVGLSAAAYAQRGMRQGGGNYNPATETTLTGTVDEVKQMPAPGRGGGGVHLILSAASGPIDVHVGPASFVTAKHVTFAKGDALTVVGSKVTMAGQVVVIAREIKKGDQTLTLRDEKGIPLWAGQRPTR